MPCTYEDRLEIIAAYVRHQLPEQAQESFEEHYLGCDECGRDLLLMEKTALVMKRHGGLIFQRRHRTPAFLRNFLHRKTHDSIGALAVHWLRAHGPALAGYAVLVLILGAGYFWLDRYQHTADNESSGQYDEAGTAGPSFSAGQTPAYLRQPEWPASSVAGVSDPALAQMWEEARQAYEKQQYQQALPLLALLVQALPDQSRLLLFQGVSLLRIGKPEAARAVLQDLVQRQPDDSAAQWFLAESCLEHDPDQAQLLYEQLAARGDSLYRAAARQRIHRH